MLYKKSGLVILARSKQCHRLHLEAEVSATNRVQRSLLFFGART